MRAKLEEAHEGRRSWENWSFCVDRRARRGAAPPCQTGGLRAAVVAEGLGGRRHCGLCPPARAAEGARQGGSLKTAQPPYPCFACLGRAQQDMVAAVGGCRVLSHSYYSIFRAHAAGEARPRVPVVCVFFAWE